MLLTGLINFMPAASISADKFDAFWKFIWISSLITFVVVVGAAIYFAIKYKRKKIGEETPYIPHSYAVEFGSIFITAIWVTIIFLWGWADYKHFITPKQDEYEINVIGQQWSWQMQYANGKTLTNEMYVPRDRPVKLIMSSKDVLHSFGIPAFRVKQDLVPGQFTVLRFTANKNGAYDIFCDQYCGVSHSNMIAKIHVVDPEDFQKWLDGMYKKSAVKAGEAVAAPVQTLAERGADLYKTKTCNTCHSVNGATIIGPTFKGLWGSEKELVDGSKVAVDENYIRESVMDPMKKIVKGFPPAMPTFRGIISDEEMNAIIAYMKTLK